MTNYSHYQNMKNTQAKLKAGAKGIKTPEFTQRK